MRHALASFLLIPIAACSSPAKTAPGGPTPPRAEAPVAAPATVGGNDLMRRAVQVSAPDAFARECRRGLDAAKALLPVVIAAQPTRTRANTLEPFNRLQIELERSAALAGLMSSIHPDQAVRDQAKACEQEVEKFGSELGLNRALYEAFAAIDVATLDAEAQRLVEHNLRDFRRAGVDKDEATRKRIEALNQELVTLGQKFDENIVKDVRAVEIDPKELAGLPEDYISAHKPGDSGKVRITTDYPDFIPFMEYARSGSARKKLFIEYNTRGGMDNELVLRQILTLREEKAKLLGYANWADYITEDKMMGSGDNAAEFITRIAGIARKRANEDYQELLAYKRKDDRKAKVVESWEKNYYANKVKAGSYSFDPQSVRPYFEYGAVEAGLLDITAAIYDLEYRPVTDMKLWHEDVRAYDVLRDGAAIGRIYLDMHPREGKYKHAAQFTLLSGVTGTQLPEGVLVCNFPNPRTANGPALMEHDDVATMFHEFGHLMHHVLAGQKTWIDHSGVATEWDFVEAPSQMFEEWAWEHETLSRFAKHYQTGEVIPAQLVAQMRRAHEFGRGTDTLQQMLYASMSLEFHRRDPKNLEMAELAKALQEKYTPFPFVDGTRQFASFGHLNGYSAMYYTYMWSLVIARDLLTPFKEQGLMNPEWTRRYRDLVLAPGGTKDAADLVKDFLGRPFSFAAFEAYLGG